jgi:hypothetical protein
MKLHKDLFCYLTFLTIVASLPHCGPWGMPPELLFEKKGLTPAVKQLLTSCLIEVSFDTTENGPLQFEKGSAFP